MILYADGADAGAQFDSSARPRHAAIDATALAEDVAT